MEMIVGLKLGDTGLDAGDALAALIKDLTTLQAQCYRSGQVLPPTPKTVPIFCEVDGSNFHGQKVGYFSVNK